jgi:hypothetical protein
MKALRKGDKGPYVKKWQYFLAGQGFTKIVADGVFGDKTHEATIEFSTASWIKARRDRWHIHSFQSRNAWFRAG